MCLFISQCTEHSLKPGIAFSEYLRCSTTLRRKILIQSVMRLFSVATNS